jgi:hypothetical protein
MQEKRTRLLMITSEWPVARSHPSQSPPPATLPSSPLKRQAEALQAAGFWVEIFAFRGRNFYNYAAAWTRLRPRLHPGRYDVVHAQDASNVVLALPKRVPLVVSLEKRNWLAWFWAWRADAVIVPSEEIGRKLGTRTPVHVIAPETDDQTRTERLVDVYRGVLPNSW